MASSKSHVRRKVLVLYVGGLFGMKKNQQDVYSPVPNALTALFKLQSELHDPEFGEKHFGTLKENELVLPESTETILLYEIRELMPLLDSSNMRPSDWVRMVNGIAENYEHYDGFVIIHGADTICYCASAFSFMLEKFQKPVIFTVARMPIFEIRSNAKDNLLNSLILAGCFQIPEVCIFSSGKLLRGNRTINVSPESFDAFESCNYPSLADVGMDTDIHYDFIHKSKDKGFKINTTLNTKVAVLNFSPTITVPMVEAMVKSPIEGLVLQTYGAGSSPTHDEDLLNVFKWAIENGILLVNISQCPERDVYVTYSTEKWLKEIGIVNGRDMTCEAAVAKLCYVLGFQSLSYKEKFKMMEKDLRGEITKPPAQSVNYKQ